MRIVLKPQAITEHLTKNQISRDELARQMGVSAATTYRVDAGRVDPSPMFIANLMRVTGLPFEALFDIVGQDVA